VITSPVHPDVKDKLSFTPPRPPVVVVSESNSLGQHAQRMKLEQKQESFPGIYKTMHQ